eukprot:TRINITY_DN84844_c0_g1_i1.p1 TRINITY_DN84844_c0_g1~~TRINITY_DN84844_c0_g1_i1.p1  ORF type:complete len:240 (-),score=31.02 TRINITY_DN84844_c0_g1_i1:43-711(-)
MSPAFTDESPLLPRWCTAEYKSTESAPIKWEPPALPTIHDDAASCAEDQECSSDASTSGLTRCNTLSTDSGAMTPAFSECSRVSSQRLSVRVESGSSSSSIAKHPQPWGRPSMFASAADVDVLCRKSALLLKEMTKAVAEGERMLQAREKRKHRKGPAQLPKSLPSPWPTWEMIVARSKADMSTPLSWDSVKGTEMDMLDDLPTLLTQQAHELPGRSELLFC